MNEKSEFIITECVVCDAIVKVPLSAKSFVCPRCGADNEFNAQAMNDNLNIILRELSDTPDEFQDESSKKR